MKIMISVSGGLDSTVLLYETLRDTDHEITALHVEEDYFIGIPDNVRIENASCRRIVAYLKANVREFDFVSRPPVKHTSDGRPFSQEETNPVRPGFLQRRNTYWIKCRNASLGRYTDELKPDQTLVGLTAWDMVDWISIGEAAYYDYTDIPRSIPWVRKSVSGGRVRYLGPGRFQIMKRLPEALRPMIVSCSAPAKGVVCGFCKICVDWNFYDEHCRTATVERVEKIEDRLARLGFHGVYFHLADPMSYDKEHIKSCMLDSERWTEETFNG